MDYICWGYKGKPKCVFKLIGFKASWWFHSCHMFGLQFDDCTQSQLFHHPIFCCVLPAASGNLTDERERERDTLLSCHYFPSASKVKYIQYVFYTVQYVFYTVQGISNCKPTNLYPVLYFCFEAWWSRIFLILVKVEMKTKQCWCNFQYS